MVWRWDGGEGLKSKGAEGVLVLRPRLGAKIDRNINSKGGGEGGGAGPRAPPGPRLARGWGWVGALKCLSRF